MRNNRLYLFFLVVLAIALLLVGFSTRTSQASPAAEMRPPTIKLLAGEIIPGPSSTAPARKIPSIPADLMLERYAADEAGYFIVQFRGPVQPAWKEQVTAVGGELLDYIPDFAFKVRMTNAQADRVAQLGSVNWVGVFQPAYKLGSTLPAEGTHLFKVRIERGVPTGPVAEAVARAGVEIIRQSGDLLIVAVDASRLSAVARITDVAWIEHYVLPQTENEYGGGVIIKANTANANGYDGSTQIVAVADTGIGNGSPTGAHRDIPSSRVQAIFDWPGVSDSCFDAVSDGPQDVDSGHGTHTAASVLSGGGPGGEGRGTAPAAKLVFQAVEDYGIAKGICRWIYGNGYYLLGLPDDLRDLFQQAYNAGARIHSNSWGASVAGEYNANSFETDDFMWNNPDMLVTTSAGNAGIDSNSDGVVDDDSIGSPATAKNILTVGASENDRQGNWNCDAGLSYTTCASQGGQNTIFTYGAAWGSDFPVNPLKDDPAAGNAQQMAAFSSRGPTDDGRIKPDIVAPGTYVLSGYSDMYQQGYDPSPNPRNNAWQYDGWGFPLNAFYKYMGGTSMSNPLAAGGAAVVRDFYKKAHGFDASAALVKATLINSAVDMLDENNDGVNDNAFPIPNNHEGWGLVNLANATDGSHQFVEGAGLATNGTATYQYSVASAGSPFKVTLVWTDYPGSTTAAKALVNDLDLVVTAPNGATYRGNVFSGGWSTTGGSADRTNNVENVYVQSAAAGTWTVQVSGFNAPNGPQPFALVVDGVFGATPPTATPTNTAVPPTATPTNTPVPPTPTNTPVGPTATPTNTPVPPTATNTPAPPTPTATPVSGATMHVGDLDGSGRYTFGTFRWVADVTITVHDSSENPVANATVSGSWSTGGTSSCTTNSSGTCTVTSGTLTRRDASTTFTVSNVTHASLTYQPADNHDPDGDSNGTSITVNRP